MFLVGVNASRKDRACFNLPIPTKKIILNICNDVQKLKKPAFNLRKITYAKNKLRKNLEARQFIKTPI